MNPLAWLLVAAVAICAVCVLACWIGDDTITVEADEPELLAADCLCMVAGCPREWQTDRSGWRLCHTHYRELVTNRGGAA